MKEFLPYIAMVFSALSFLLAVATFVRSGRWKEAETLRDLADTVARHESRLAEGEERFEHLATKADVTGLKAEVSALEKSIDKVDAGVVRIERILMGAKS